VAHFRAVIQGQGGEASRLGTKASGIYARVQTWGKDLAVHVTHENGRDVARVYIIPHGAPSETPTEQVAQHVLRVVLREGSL